MKKFVAVFCISLFGIIARAQAPTNNWLLWRENDERTHSAALYKVQDGACSLYIVTSNVNANESVAITAGQGCK